MLNAKNIFKFLILAQILILSSVYYIEYVMDIYACKLCKYQRFPFFFNIICLFLLIVDKKRFYYFLHILCISIVINIGIAFYHLGIERKFFSENQACIVKENAKNEVDLLNQLINKQNNGCAEVKFKLFKLSLSELNFLINIVFLLICVQIIRYEKKQKN
tara:strand:+ start:673 stop:1152 length:480 start_codon:yes stop_codon:yes gene_type:complete